MNMDAFGLPNPLRSIAALGALGIIAVLAVSIGHGLPSDSAKTTVAPAAASDPLERLLASKT